MLYKLRIDPITTAPTIGKVESRPLPPPPKQLFLKAYHASIRLQCGDRHLEKLELHCLGCRRPR